MMGLHKNHARTNVADQYGTCADSQVIFADDLDHLYLLAYLRTADHEKAEQCFVAGLSDSVATNQVFLDWARSWARRAVIQNASTKSYPADSISGYDSEDSYLKDFEMHCVLALDDFDWFVLAKSVLERYSDQDTSALLGCTPKQVGEGRARTSAD